MCIAIGRCLHAGLPTDSNREPGACIVGALPHIRPFVNVVRNRPLNIRQVFMARKDDIRLVNEHMSKFHRQDFTDAWDRIRAYIKEARPTVRAKRPVQHVKYASRGNKQRTWIGEHNTVKLNGGCFDPISHGKHTFTIRCKKLPSLSYYGCGWR
jgi:hypothetical protein